VRLAVARRGAAPAPALGLGEALAWRRPASAAHHHQVSRPLLSALIFRIRGAVTHVVGKTCMKLLILKSFKTGS